MAKANIPEKGAIIQRDMETYSISPHIPGGFIEPAMLRKIADVAEKYNARYVKLTGAQRMAIIGIREEDLDKAWAEFTDRSKAIGLTIRSIQICPGSRACKKAKQDSPGLDSPWTRSSMASRHQPNSKWAYQDAKTVAAIPG